LHPSTCASLRQESLLNLILTRLTVTMVAAAVAPANLRAQHQASPVSATTMTAAHVELAVGIPETQSASEPMREDSSEKRRVLLLQSILIRPSVQQRQRPLNPIARQTSQVSLSNLGTSTRSHLLSLASSLK